MSRKDRSPDLQLLLRLTMWDSYRDRKFLRATLLEAEIDGVRSQFPAHRGRVQLTVADDGPGISAEDREQIFEPFFSTNSDGTELGLALVERLIDEVDGEVSCGENAEGGATFRILLPEPAPPPRAPAIGESFEVPANVGNSTNPDRRR